MPEFNQLSDREWEVIRQLLQGKSNKLIAASLNISISTVEFHLKNIYSKMQINSRLELILALWKATSKVEIEELGYSVVDCSGDSVENGDRSSTYPYERIRKTMRLYRIVLIACAIAIIFPLVMLSIHAIRRPDSIIIWRGILIWLVPAVGIMLLLMLFPRTSFRSLSIIASVFLLGILIFGFVAQYRTDLIFDFIDLRFWLVPYLIGGGGILIASRHRTLKPES